LRGGDLPFRGSQQFRFQLAGPRPQFINRRAKLLGKLRVIAAQQDAAAAKFVRQSAKFVVVIGGLNEADDGNTLR